MIVTFKSPKVKDISPLRYILCVFSHLDKTNILGDNIGSLYSGCLYPFTY